jgi:hypothetical protein
MDLSRPLLEPIADEDLLNTWDYIVGPYSQLLLSFPKDKLPALAGIASLFSTHLKDSDYLAGTWKALLPESLFWHTSPVEPWVAQLTRREYQAPSWSWAGSNTPVMFTSGTLQEDCTILDIWCDVPGKNPFGEVSMGCMEVAGLYLEQPIMNFIPGNPRQVFKMSFFGSDVWFQFHPDDVYSHLDYGEGEYVMPWTVVFIGKGTGSTYAGAGCPLVLVLEESAEIEDAYVRIGLGTCHDLSFSETEKWCRDDPIRVFNIL